MSDPRPVHDGGRLLQLRAGRSLARDAPGRNSEGVHERLALGLRELLEHLQLLGGRRLLRHRSWHRRADR